MYLLFIESLLAFQLGAAVSVVIKPWIDTFYRFSTQKCVVAFHSKSVSFSAWILHFLQFLSKISHAYIESDSFEFKVICSNQIVCCFSISVDFQLGSALSC